MSTAFALEASVREVKGRSASRRLRREHNQIPGIVYGAGKEPVQISLCHNSILHSSEHEAFYSQVIDLTVGGKKEAVILKDIQRHPFKPKILHVDFLRVDAKAELQTNVPLHFLNEEKSVGVKAGGQISHLMTEVEISCLPADLPEYIEVDLGEVEVGQTVHLSDVKLPKGVVSVALSHGEDHDLPVVSIQLPKKAEESSDDSAEAADDSAADDNA